MIELSEEQFRTFLDNHPQKTFLQTPEIAKIRQKNGWDIHYLGFKENDILVAATMIVSAKKFLNKKMFYAPRGVLIDYNNYNLLSNFINKLKEWVKIHDGFIIRIEPYIAHKQRNIDGNVVDNGFDNTPIVNNLKKIGFNKVKISEQVKWMFVIDVENKSSDEILKNMNSNTRKLIKNSIKYGVKVREIKDDELHVFKEIVDNTGLRKNIAMRNINYYINMYNLFKPRNNIRYLIAEVNLFEYKNTLFQERITELEKINKLHDKKDSELQIKDLQKTIESLDKKIKYIEELQSKNKSTINVSAGMFVTYGDEVLYLSGGGIGEYMQFNGQYAIQWEMIDYAVKNGYKRYNFYGISGNFDQNDKNYGVYKFKRGFNGYVEELIGEFDYPVTSLYYLYKSIQNIKGLIRGNHEDWNS